MQRMTHPFPQPLSRKRERVARRAGRGGQYFYTVAGTLLSFAAHAGEAAKHLPAAEPLGAGNLLQLTFGLLVVLAAIVGSAWLLRRYGRLQSGVHGALRVVGGLSMGPRERVVLVQVGKTQLLLGVAPGRVQTLHVLDEPVIDAEAFEPSAFAAKLGAVLKK